MINRLIKISVIILVKNGENTLGYLLQNLKAQTMNYCIEIVVIDSGSSDNSINIAKSFSAKIVEILPSEFGHGKTRNLGVSCSQGEFCLFITQDAIPQDNKLLEKLYKHFENKNVVSVGAREEVPVSIKTNPLEWTRITNLGGASFSQWDEEIDDLSPLELRRKVFMSNVCTMYRKEILQKYPFEEVVFGEDIAWGKHILLANLGILVNEPNAKVYHYHEVDYDATYKRIMIENIMIWECFMLMPILPYKSISFLKLFFQIIKYRCNIKWFFYNYQKMKAKNQACKDFRLAILKNEYKQIKKEFCSKSPQAKNIAINLKGFIK